MWGLWLAVTILAACQGGACQPEETTWRLLGFYPTQATCLDAQTTLEHFRQYDKLRRRLRCLIDGQDPLGTEAR